MIAVTNQLRNDVRGDGRRVSRADIEERDLELFRLALVNQWSAVADRFIFLACL